MTVKNSKMARRYGEEFKRQAVELLLHSGKTQRQVARELDVSDLQFNPLEKGLPGPAEAGRDRGADKEPGGDGKDHSGATQRDRISEAPAVGGHASMFAQLLYAALYGTLTSDRA